ncbi:hypothetical protein D7X33_21095, partial [Butyricicoccus sp. 1XD8-22]
MSILDTIFPYLNLLGVLIGLWLIFLPVFVPVLNGFLIRARRIKRKELKDSSPFIQEIAQLLEVAINRGSLGAAYSFLALVLSLWIINFFVLLEIYPLLFALIGSLFTPLLAMVFLNIRIYMNRVKISYEGMTFITELTNNYRIHHNDLVTAMEFTHRGLNEKSLHSKKMLQHLIYRIRNVTTQKDYEVALEQMIFTYDTSWSKQLASLFKLSLIKGWDITEGLLDVQNDLKDLEKLNEKKRQINIQTGFMLFGLIPIMIVTGIYFVFVYSEFTIQKFIEYQF